MTTGEKIRTLRKQLGWTQTELGLRLGVKVNAVSKWECGRVEAIPMSKVKAMANLFDVPTSYLIDEEPKIEKEPVDPTIDRLRKAGYFDLSEENKKLVDLLAQKLLDSQSDE